jgi:membrane protease YdiL (CAAX protease family)
MARGYVISELLNMRCGAALAVAFSVALQISYHLYQGGPAALHLAIVFTVVSVYYVKTGRLTPVILVHFYFDLVALLSAAHPAL